MKPDFVADVGDPSKWKAKAGRLWVQSQPGTQSRITFPEKQNNQKRMRGNSYYIFQLLIHEFTAKKVTHKA